MSRSRTKRLPIVGYFYESKATFDEEPVEKVLTKAQASGVVVDFDTGRGYCVWFNGYPGKAMRDLRARIRRLIPDAKSIRR